MSHIHFGEVESQDYPESEHRYGKLYTDIHDVRNQMRDNLTSWCSEAYSAIQEGEISVKDLGDPTMLADEWSTDYESTGHHAYAASSLAALGLQVDLKNQMVFELDDGTTMEGTLYVSESPESGFNVGTTYDPADISGPVYIAYDAQSGMRPLTEAEHYRAAIDGGEFRIYGEPFEQSVYQIETSAGETVNVETGEFVEDTDATDTEYTVDLSSELENTITEASSVKLYAQDDVKGQVIRVEQPFTIVEATDIESGEKVESVTTESYNQQTSDVSLTEEQLEKWQELVDDIDNYTQDDGGGGGLNLGLDLGGGSLVWLVALGGGGLIAFDKLTGK
jgi:hypothetical protein